MNDKLLELENSIKVYERIKYFLEQAHADALAHEKAGGRDAVSAWSFRLEIETLIKSVNFDIEAEKGLVRKEKMMMELDL